MILNTMNKNRSLESFLECHAQGKIRPGFSNYYYSIEIELFGSMVNLTFPRYIQNFNLKFNGDFIVAKEKNNGIYTMGKVKCFNFDEPAILSAIKKLLIANNHLIELNESTKNELKKIGDLSFEI